MLGWQHRREMWITCERRKTETNKKFRGQTLGIIVSYLFIVTYYSDIHVMACLTLSSISQMTVQEGGKIKLGERRLTGKSRASPFDSALSSP